MRHAEKTQLPFDNKSFRPLCPLFYDRAVGEAETGNAGEQPDRGIAGRNSSGTMRRACSSRHVLWLGSGAAGGRQQFPVQAWACPGIGQIDSVNASKTHFRAPGNSWQQRSGGEGIVASAPLTIKKTHRLTSRSCGEFPCTGRTLPSRHLRSRNRVLILMARAAPA